MEAAIIKYNTLRQHLNVKENIINIRKLIESKNIFINVKCLQNVIMEYTNLDATCILLLGLIVSPNSIIPEQIIEESNSFDIDQIETMNLILEQLSTQVFTFNCDKYNIDIYKNIIDTYFTKHNETFDEYKMKLSNIFQKKIEYRLNVLFTYYFNIVSKQIIIDKKDRDFLIKKVKSKCEYSYFMNDITNFNMFLKMLNLQSDEKDELMKISIESIQSLLEAFKADKYTSILMISYFYNNYNASQNTYRILHNYRKSILRNT